MKKFRPLSKSLTYRIMAVVMVMMVAITGFVYYYVTVYMLKEAQLRYSGILMKHYEEFRRRLSDVYVAAENNVHDIERDIEHPDAMYGHMERIVRNNKGLKSCAVLFEPGYYPEKGYAFIPMIRRDTTDVIYTANTDSIYGYYQAKWYKECMAGDSGMWVGAKYDNKRFPDAKRRTLLTTYATPVHDLKGTSVGLLCVQLSIEPVSRDLRKEIKLINEKFEEGLRRHSYFFLVDHFGNYIIHPDKKRTENSSILEQTKETPGSIDENVVAKIVQGGDGEAMTDVDGVPSWIYYRTVKYVNWTMVIVVPKENLFHNGSVLNAIILLAMLIGLVAIYFICSQMIKNATKPLRSIALSAEEVALGNFSSQLPDVKSLDEVMMLRDSFEIMQTSLSLYVDKVRSTTAEKAAFENELSNARDIQMTMVPNQFPPFPERNDIDIYGMMEPAKSVGGDLFDFLIHDNHLFFCIGDVSGKGMPAALLMAVTRSLFHSISMEEWQPSRIMWRINRSICEGNKNNMFVTMFIGALDLETGHLDYCNAGHEAPLLSGRPLPIKRNKPVGALADWNFEGQETQLQPGDMLFLYTDGLSEARSQNKKRLGRAYVAQLVAQQHCDTTRQLVELMAKEVHGYAAGTEQSDDITLLAIKWEGFSRLCMRAVMDEIDRLKPFVLGVASQAGVDPKETKRIRGAVEEAVANVIHYGQATTITLQARKDDGQLIITIDDDGLPFDPTQGSATDLSIPANQRPPGGMGILMLQRMTDGLSYQRTDGHNILTLIKNI